MSDLTAGSMARAPGGSVWSPGGLRPNDPNKQHALRVPEFSALVDFQLATTMAGSPAAVDVALAAFFQACTIGEAEGLIAGCAFYRTARADRPKVVAGHLANVTRLLLDYGKVMNGVVSELARISPPDDGHSTPGGEQLPPEDPKA